MSTKSKSKPSTEKAKKESSSSQSLLKKTGKNVMATLNSVKSTLVGGKGAKGSKTDGQKKSASNGIYIKGITHKQSLDDIKSIFQAAGAIKECRRRSDKYALIWFVDHNSVKKAIDMFHHKPTANFSSTSDGAAFETLSINERARKSNPCLYASGKRNPSTLTKYIVQHAQVAPPADRATYCKTIFVNGLPNAQILPNALLRAAFAKYGKVVKMVRYGPTAFTFVYYADVASAVKAQKDIEGKGLANLLKNVELPKPTKASQKGDGKKQAAKKEAKPFVMPKGEFKLHVELSVRTKERDDAREVTARKHSKHKEDYKKWVRGTGF